MILTNFLVGLPAMLVCLAIQAFVAFWCVRYYVRQIRRLKPEDHSQAGIRPLLVAMVAMMLGTFVQVGLWGVLFVVLGEFTELYEAVYHSAVNFASLGYGDIVMSKELEAARPAGSHQRRADARHERCSADGHPPAVDQAAVSRRFADCGRRRLAVARCQSQGWPFTWQ